MSTPRRRRSAAASRPRRWRPSPLFLLGTLGVLAVLLVVGLLLGKMWVEAYLRGESFRQFISAQTSELLHARGELAPLHLSGTTLYSQSFDARGGPEAAFAQLHVEHLRAEVSTRRLFEKIWQVDQVTLQRVELHLEGPRDLSLQQLGARPIPDAGWLPDRAELAAATILDTNLSWADATFGAGTLSSTRVDLAPREGGGWKIAAQGGRVEMAGFPGFELNSAKLYSGENALYLQSAELHLAGKSGSGGSGGSGGTGGTGGTGRTGGGGVTGGGRVQISGEVHPERLLELHVTADNLPVTPFLSEDWRVRLHGDISGEFDLKTPLPSTNGPTLSGKLSLQDGRLEALPVLNKIAAYTLMQQFLRLPLSRASADFTQLPGKLSVQNLLLESAGLIRVEGAFTLIHGILNGTFQVGVTPSSLQWLPGSQAKVFKDSRGAYVWTTVRLTGPANDPVEDLSPRLTAAAREAIVEGAENSARDTLKTGTDTVKGVLDLLLPGSK